MNKQEIIEKIMTFHPGSGTDKGYSWYVGGMRDTGAWYKDKLEAETEENLLAFLNPLIADKEEGDRKRREWEALSDKEKEIKRKEMFEEEQKALRKFFDDKTRALLWGK